MWFRSDLRIKDNPALAAAAATNRPVIPVFILDDVHPGKWAPGGASRWWLHQSLSALRKSAPVVCLRGDARETLIAFVKDTGAESVFWNRCYEPWSIVRDKKIKTALKEMGIATESFNGSLLFEPWEIMNKTGSPYKVFSPYAHACFSKPIRPPDDTKIKVKWKDISSQNSIGSLGLMPKIEWYKGIEKIWAPGERGAAGKLKAILEDTVLDYSSRRDFPAQEGTSRLSPHLHFGEVSPHAVWHAVSRHFTALKSSPAAQPFLRQLIWREFSWYLLYHFPGLPEKPWNPKFASFSWLENDVFLKRWQQGQTGYPIVDAGMRQLWQTGWMHNRVRMIAGSFLVKNLLLDWRLGEKWFWDTLVDADLGNNASGWQWIAGCGADAAPYFRIFNPVLQSKKFDPHGQYIKSFVPELHNIPDKYIHAPWTAPADILKKSGIVLGNSYPQPIVDHALARTRALEAYKRL